MKPRLFTAIVIFSASYLPLSFIIFAQNIDVENVTEHFSCFVAQLIFLIITISSFLAVYFFLRRVKSKKNRTIFIHNYEEKSFDVINYTLPYVVSLVSFDFYDMGKFISFLSFFLLMFFINYKTGRLFLNPMFLLIGWNFYSIKYTCPGDEEECTGFVLVDGMMETGEYFQVKVENVFLISGQGE